jgi:N-acetylmuramoyl-L-alanine amidase
VTAVLAGCLLLGAAHGALAQISFTAEVGGEMRTATLSPVESDGGITYVSLEELVRQLGGEVRSVDGRTQVDLAGASAMLGVGDRAVESSSDAFSLQEPLARVGESPYIAMVDISPFFFRGFEMFVSRYDSAEPSANPPAVESVPLLEPISPEEEIPSDAPEAAEATAEAGMLTPMESLPPEAVEAPALLEEEPAPIALAEAPPTDTPPSGGDESLPPALRSAKTIVIDPGHGGYDTGAMGMQGVTEKEITLAVAVEVGRILKTETDLTIYLTRQEDKELTTPDRVGIANEVTGDLLVSIHVGALRAVATAEQGALPRGCAVFYWGPPEGASARTARYTASSQVLAEGIAQALSGAMGTAWPAGKPHAAPLRLLGDIRMPGVLVELGYVTTPEDAALLASEAGRQRMARGIADGIKQALGRESR